jgi:hypothetical protein
MTTGISFLTTTTQTEQYSVTSAVARHQIIYKHRHIAYDNTFMTKK